MRRWPGSGSWKFLLTGPLGLLTIRAAVVLLVAILAAAAGLRWLTRGNTAEAILAGLSVLAGGIRFFHRLIT